MTEMRRASSTEVENHDMNAAAAIFVVEGMPSPPKRHGNEACAYSLVEQAMFRMRERAS